MKKLISFIILVLLALTFTQSSRAEFISDNVYLNNASDPATVTEIQTELTVFDDLDGNLTDSVYVVLDNYTGHESELGDFIIVFGVVDSGSNIVTYALTVRNVDITAPVIELLNIESLLIPQFSVLAQNLPNIVATDYIDGDLTSNFQISGLDLINTDILGDYELVYSITDLSGNTISETFTISILDSVLPVLVGPDVIIKKTDYILPGDFFVSYFSATDNLDGIISNRIIIVSNGYLGNANVPGIYEIVLSVSDLAGNTAVHSLFIEVKDDMIPFLIIDNYNWVVASGYNLTDIDFINTLKIVGDLPNSTFVFNNVLDSYSSNFSVEGSYTKTFSLISSIGEDYERTVLIEVVPGTFNVVEETPDTPTFLDNVWIIIKKWWIAIVIGILIIIGLTR